MSDLDAQISSARKKRRAGYAFFGIITLYLIIPMLVGAFGGASAGKIYDPYTGEPLSEKESVARWCFDEASRLIQEAGRLDRLARTWDEPARQWTAKCRAEHAELHQVMVETRSQLQARGKDVDKK